MGVPPSFLFPLRGSYSFSILFQVTVRKLGSAAQHLFQAVRDRLILAGREKELREMLSADRFLQEVLIDVLQNAQHIPMSHFFHLVQDLLVPLLRYHPLRRIAIAFAKAEGLGEDLLQLQLSAPAEVLREGKRDGVSVIDLGEEEAVQGLSIWPQSTFGKLFSASIAPSPVPHPVTTKSAAPLFSRIAARSPAFT